jgi:hypothetical protein
VATRSQRQAKIARHLMRVNTTIVKKDRPGDDCAPRRAEGFRVDKISYNDRRLSAQV